MKQVILINCLHTSWMKHETMIKLWAPEWTKYWLFCIYCNIWSDWTKCTVWCLLQCMVWLNQICFQWAFSCLGCLAYLSSLCVMLFVLIKHRLQFVNSLPLWSSWENLLKESLDILVENIYALQKRWTGNSAISARPTHRKLKKDLIEHIWQRYVNKGN